jgi:hypothetical protein
MQTTNNHNYSLIKDFLPQWKTVQRFSWGAPDLIVNKCKEKGNLLQVSDSYFKACAQVKFEGAHGNIFPIADDVHRYLHCHYADITTSALDIVSTQFQPDFMVESFVERTCNQWSTNDPYLLTIADLFLQTGYALVIDPHEIPLAKLPVHQASWSEGDGGLVFHSQGSQSYINSDTSSTDSSGRIIANNEGQIVLIARIESPVETEAVWNVRSLTSSNGKWEKVQQPIKKGLNHVRMEGVWPAGDQVEWKFTPGQIAGEYVFKEIPEARKLKQKERVSHAKLKIPTDSVNEAME